MDTLLARLAHYGYVALFTLLVLGIVGLPVPDEALLLLAGYLVFTHELALAPTLAAAGLGSLCGITLSYALGRLIGRSVVHGLGRWVRVDPAHLARMQAWYVRGGKYLLLVGYYIPGVRHLTAYVAGALQLAPPVFALFAYTGGFL